MQTKGQKDQRFKKKEGIHSLNRVIKELKRILASKHPKFIKLNYQTSVKLAKNEDRAQVI